MVSQKTAIGAGHDAVAAALNDERGPADLRQHRTHVNLIVSNEQPLDGAGRRRLALVARQHLGEVAVACAPRAKEWCRTLRAPGLKHHRQHALQAGPDGEVGGLGEARHGGEHHQPIDQCRVGGGEECGHGAAFGRGEEHRALRACGLHHRAHVVHALLQGGRALQAVRHALATLVEDQHTKTQRQAAQHGGVGLVVPVGFDVGDDARHHHQVLRAAAEDLVGDAEAVAVSEVRGRRRQRVAHGS